MSHNYSEEDDFDGFSDPDEPQVYVENDVPEHYSHIYDGDSLEAPSDSGDELEDHTGYIDDEASEADSESESETSSKVQDANIPGTLHKFGKLPIELREMIWKTFCPDLSTNPRVYELKFNGKDLQFAAQVEDQIIPLRTVLSIHQESRALGHKFAPNLIQLRHSMGVAPWHLERDIVFVDWSFDHRYCPRPEELAILEEAAPGLQNLAFTAGVTFYDGGADLERIYSLKNVFISHEAEDVPTRGLTWCISDKNHTYHVVHQEDMGSGINEDVDILFSWPNPDQYGQSGEENFSSRQFASLQFDQEGMTVTADGERISEDPTSDEIVSNWGWEIARLREWLDPLHEMHQQPTDQSRSGSSESETDEPAIGVAQEKEHEDVDEHEGNEEQRSPPQPQRISVWPFTRFMFASGVDRLEAMKAWRKPWDEWESDHEQDEYEEDESDIDSDDSLNDFIAPDDTIDPEADDEIDSSQSEDEQDFPNRAAQRHHLVLDSEDEDESSTEPGESSEIQANNRAVIDLVDSSNKEEEDPAPQPVGSSRRRARARPIPVDSEDDEDDEDDDVDSDVPQSSRPGARRVAVVLSDSEGDIEEADDREKGGARSEDEEDSSSGEEEGSDEEPAPPPRMSLAKRLRLEAAQARAARSANTSDDEGQDGEGGASDEDDSPDGDEMIMGMAEEGEEEDEEAW